ncbi:hypothetical protein BVRB_1g002540 [Beta vulgaris subsp. vulgaris]|uniref:vegetative cell wall protein gp1 n=1 Tax=Beta vulgaris subsp. vulgaris TaxID=3555 RepID=UPI00053F34A7|nr:vegetative cell wall protein gp1 [Beta vulgaris subsp. vulgaris]KMT20250.1 hypothetical protein BVRB_1g002540 [Beta vulgaris subsp. vulgaris]
MSNQSQSRPWFRLATLARAPQPPAPASAPAPAPAAGPAPATAPRPQNQPLVPPRPPLRPAFRPTTQPPPAQQAAPSPAPRAPATPGPRAPSVTFSAPSPSPITTPSEPRAPTSVPPAPSPSPPSTTTSTAPRAPVSAGLAATAAPQPPAVSPTIPRSPAPAAPVAAPQPAAPPAITRTPASPLSKKSPPRSSISSPRPGPSPLSSPPKPKTQPPPPSLSSSPPPLSRSFPASPPPLSRSFPASPPKLPSPPSPPKPSFPALKQEILPRIASISLPPAEKEIASSAATNSSAKPSNGSLVTSRGNSFTASPRSSKPLPETPPQSPKTKPSLSPPSPFTLPPSQLKFEGERGAKIPTEAQQKSVVVQETVKKPKSYLESHGGSEQKAQTRTYAKPKERDFYKKSSDSEDNGMRFITIAGENKGAIMELGYSSRGRGSKLNSPYKINNDGDQVLEGNLSGNEERSKLQAKSHIAPAKPAVPMHAFMNSNVQGINSSIVFNSTCSHHDPGVHLSVTRKPLNGRGHAFQLKNQAKDNGHWFSE